MPVSEQLIIELKGEFDKYVKDIQGAGKVTDSTQKKIETSFNKIIQAMRKMNDQSQKNRESVNQFGRNAGQAGIQLQQFFGQIQGGQSFLVAFGQQAADLGIVLGAAGLGAAAGIGAAAISFLTSVVKESELELQGLNEALNTLITNFDELNQSQQEVATAALGDRFDKDT